MDAATAGAGPAVLRRVLAGQRRAVAAAAALFMSWQACEALVPVVIGAVIDRAVATGDRASLLRWLLLLAVLFAVLSCSFRFGLRAARRAVERSAHALRLQTVGALLDLRRPLDREWRTGAVVSVAGTDAQAAGLVAELLPMGLAALTSLAVAAVALLRISVPLGLVVLLGAPPLLYLTARLGRLLDARVHTEQAGAASAAALATDLLRGLRVLKGIGGERAAVARYEQASGASARATTRAATAEAVYSGTTLGLTLGFLAVVALVGGRFAVEGRITIGELVAAVGLAQFLIGPLSQLARLGSLLARARASAARVASLLGEPEPGTAVAAARVDGMRPAVAPPPPVPDDIPALEAPTAAGPALAVGPGEIVGFVADVAAATALVEVLADPRGAVAGTVLVGGRPLDALPPDEAASVLLVARHEADLFGGSVRENVAVGAAAAGDADGGRVDAALAAAGATSVAATLPAGLDTLLTERGASLSGGQRQRIALARALAADPPVLVLHDPTTAVDAATEASIASGLRRLRAGRTTLLVTTSPVLLAATDRVVLADPSGQLYDGTHRELAEVSGVYRELVLV